MIRAPHVLRRFKADAPMHRLYVSLRNARAPADFVNLSTVPSGDHSCLTYVVSLPRFLKFGRTTNLLKRIEDHSRRDMWSRVVHPPKRHEALWLIGFYLEDVEMSVKTDSWLGRHFVEGEAEIMRDSSILRQRLISMCLVFPPFSCPRNEPLRVGVSPDYGRD